MQEKFKKKSEPSIFTALNSMKWTEKFQNFLFLFVFQVVTGTAGMSIGASGALFTILGIYGTLMPESEWSIILLPMYSFTAENGIKGKY